MDKIDILIEHYLTEGMFGSSSYSLSPNNVIKEFKDYYGPRREMPKYMYAYVHVDEGEKVFEVGPLDSFDDLSHTKLPKGWVVIDVKAKRDVSREFNQYKKSAHKQGTIDRRNVKGNLTLVHPSIMKMTGKKFKVILSKDIFNTDQKPEYKVEIFSQRRMASNECANTLLKSKMVMVGLLDSNWYILNSGSNLVLLDHESDCRTKIDAYDITPLPPVNVFLKVRR